MCESTRLNNASFPLTPTLSKVREDVSILRQVRKTIANMVSWRVDELLPERAFITGIGANKKSCHSIELSACCPQLNL